MSMRKASTPTATNTVHNQATDNKDRLYQVLSISLSALSLKNESVGAPPEKRKFDDEDVPEAEMVDSTDPGDMALLEALEVDKEVPEAEMVDSTEPTDKARLKALEVAKEVAEQAAKDAEEARVKKLAEGAEVKDLSQN